MNTKDRIQEIIREEIQSILIAESKDGKMIALDQAIRAEDPNNAGMWYLKSHVNSVEEALTYIVSIYQNAIHLDKTHQDGAEVSILTKELNHIKKIQKDFFKVKTFLK